jgi:hypothetical protein
MSLLGIEEDHHRMTMSTGDTEKSFMSSPLLRRNKGGKSSIVAAATIQKSKSDSKFDPKKRERSRSALDSLTKDKRKSTAWPAVRALTGKGSRYVVI